MGLDMDFYKVNTNGEKEHLHYFRKHSDLHGLLQECWAEKNLDKTGDDFNCVDFEITLDEVKRVIDFMALHKLNVFHWHLTEDQGWRIEIKKYPLLTQKGSRRSHTNFNRIPCVAWVSKSRILLYLN